jgi:hypothetical protein
VRFAAKCNAFWCKTQKFQHPLVGIYLLLRTKNGRYFLQREMQNHSKLQKMAQKPCAYV